MSAIIENVNRKEVKSFFPICNDCKNHLKGLKCKAFNEIPEIILFGKNDHSKPLKNQKNKVIFESKITLS